MRACTCGGCFSYSGFSESRSVSISFACNALAASLGLVGLNSLDLLTDGGDFQVLELNPRPGATLDIFGDSGQTSLWRWHLDAVVGRLPPPGEPCGAARAAAVVYAPWDMVMPKALSWPDWAVDRGPAGTVVRRGEPVCTVTAAAATVAAAREAYEKHWRPRLLAGRRGMALVALS